MSSEEHQMDLYNYLTFDAEFPDDSEWDERDNLISPGGRVVARFIKESLINRCFSCSEIKQHSFYGWEFGGCDSSVSFWCLVQSGGRGPFSWLLIFEQETSPHYGLLGSEPNPGFMELLAKIHAIVSSDKRFKNISWYNRSDYENNWHYRAKSSPQ